MLWVEDAGRAVLKIGIRWRETRLEKELTRRALGNHFNVHYFTRGVGVLSLVDTPLGNEPRWPLHKQWAYPCGHEDVGDSRYCGMTAVCLRLRRELLGRSVCIQS